jgi:acetoin utilization deacetylase AcuC-like enzyme
MARRIRDMARGLEVPVGAVLEGGYEPAALAACVAAVLTALGGQGQASAAAPDSLLASMAAAQVGHYWRL